MTSYSAWTFELNPPSGFDLLHTFDNFVVGSSNQLGYIAALNAAQRPGVRAYNPLVLYGRTGLGKTHLMSAAGNLMCSQDPTCRVLYLRSEQFFRAMISARQDKAMDQFEAQFRSVSALLLQSIQFFAGKDHVQKTFFHIIKALTEGKQEVILTCDRHPGEMENLDLQLKDWLSSGLVVAIAPPDLETRAAIVLLKAAERGLRVPDDVVLWIARKLHWNVRQIESALNTLGALSRIEGCRISIELAESILRDR